MSNFGGTAGMAIRWGGWNLRRRFVFSVQLMQSDRYVPPRLALVAMPPTVVIQLGQGLNMGIRCSLSASAAICTQGVKISEICRYSNAMNVGAKKT